MANNNIPSAHRNVTSLPILAMTIAFAFAFSGYSILDAINKSSAAAYDLQSDIDRNAPNFVNETYLNQREAIGLRLRSIIETLSVSYPAARICVSLDRTIDPTYTVAECSEGAQRDSIKFTRTVWLKIAEEKVGRINIACDYPLTLSTIFPPLLLVILGFATLVGLVTNWIVERRIKKDIIAPFIAEIEKSSIDRTTVQITKQVAHDIRSPLSVLNIVASEIKGIDEDQRTLIRMALQRINDISNDLLQKSKTASHRTSTQPLEKEDVQPKPIMISSAVEALVSEKRSQLHHTQNILIKTHLQNAYGLFSTIREIELSRCLSNILDNAIEAVGNSGEIALSISKSDKYLWIEVIDNGKGMPEELLKKLGTPGVTFGKTLTKSGSGLGVSSAMEIISRNGGKVQYSSAEGRGTRVQIKLPLAHQPQWFLDRVRFTPRTTLVTVDDDPSIHGVWARRFKSYQSNQSQHITLTSPNEAMSWLKGNRIHVKSNPDDYIFLIDYEFLGSNQNGFDIIREVRSVSSHVTVVLVSSRSDEDDILRRAVEMKIAVVPKNQAHLIPIN